MALGLIAAAVAAVSVAGIRISWPQWRALLVFVAWVFLMRIALDVAGGGSVRDPTSHLLAARQAASVALLIAGALCIIASTPPRVVVEELETTRLPRSLRLLVMMLVQYPRVLRNRYDQIVEAQVARGADRPKTLPQRIRHGATLLLPVMQSELNAVGDRAGLIHLRRLDVDVAHVASGRRTPIDLVAVFASALLLVAAIAWRWRAS